MKLNSPSKPLRFVQFFCASLVLFGSYAEAQISLSYSVGNNFRFTKSDLFRIQVVNASPEVLSGRFLVSLRDHSSNTLLEFQTDPYALQPGVNVLTKSSLTIRKEAIEDASFLSALEGRGLPPGRYMACAKALDVRTSKILGSICQEVGIKASTPPALVYPLNEQQIREKQPTLSWRVPVILGEFDRTRVTFSLWMYEVLDHQTPMEALRRNRPILQQSGLERPSFSYGVDQYPLQEGLKYVWRVRAFYNGHAMGDSETWWFIHNTQKTDETKEPSQYHLLETSTGPNNDVIEAKRYLRISLDDNITREGGRYHILDSDGSIILKEQEIEKGQSTLELDLYTIRKLRRKKTYSLMVNRPNAENYKVRFLYLKEG